MVAAWAYVTVGGGSSFHVVGKILIEVIRIVVIEIETHEDFMAKILNFKDANHEDFTAKILNFLVLFACRWV